MKKVNWANIVGWVVAIACIFGIIGYNAHQSEKQATTGKQKVYAVLPLSGISTAVGEQAKKTMDIYMETNHPDFDIVFVDNQSQPSVALTALLAKTVNEQKPIVISLATAMTSAILSGISKDAFVFGNYVTEIEGKNHNYQLLTGELEEVMQPIKKYLVTSAFQKIAIVYIENEFGLLEVKYLQRNIRPNQEISAIIPLPQKAMDTRIEALKLVENNPDVICVLGIPTVGYTNIIKSLREQGYKGTIIADYAFSNPHVPKILGDAANDVITVTTITDTNATLAPKQQQIKSNLENKGLRPYILPIQIWDTLDLIQYTLKNDLPFSQETYTKMGKWNGISGEVIFPGEGHSLYPFVLVQYKDGEFVLLKE
ncbi:MAG: ABC transporter substrate-binding protein [Alphaproteobacteria bacterium]|nr:ABC transporter substrate-binding protein [Alphaproteobacteria bacterium]